MAGLPFPLWTDYSYKMRRDCERSEKQMDIVGLVAFLLWAAGSFEVVLGR